MKDLLPHTLAENKQYVNQSLHIMVKTAVLTAFNSETFASFVRMIECYYTFTTYKEKTHEKHNF